MNQFKTQINIVKVYIIRIEFENFDVSFISLKIILKGSNFQ